MTSKVVVPVARKVAATARRPGRRTAHVEVFFGFRDSGGNDASLELYLPLDVTGTTQRGVLAALPIVLAGLCLATIALLPVSLAHARRVRRDYDERHAALRYGLAAAERTRHGIARRLHDTVIPDLSATGLLLERAATTAAGAELVARAHRLVTAELSQLRTLLTDLLPAAGDDPAAALRDAIAQVHAELPDHDTPVELTVDTAVPVAPATIAMLHQIATELLRNALRHANARRRVRIGLTTTETSELLLSVCDDGAGFDPDRPPSAGHVGLRLLAQLVADDGGRLTIHSRPGAGTVAVAAVRVAPGRPVPTVPGRPEPPATPISRWRSRWRRRLRRLPSFRRP
ncbi:sensor histidine kinase [Phytohabitans flavus]|uniref:sensor histidine kinase n=1 Tax=Phytohabitans flavus TaxID=1076124 RepID=UPI00156467E9|nr:ATP-binding protein [Phytohabitans flavus]